MTGLRKFFDRSATSLGWIVAATTVALVTGIFVILFLRGAPALSWSFLTTLPRQGMTAGGILTPLMGTLALIVLSLLFALPLGIGTGLWLAEYAGDGPLSRALRGAISCLAGVPSVVFGLFGLRLFVILCQFGPSLLAAALTLACLSLPLIVTASETAFRAVPQEWRQASLALGAGKAHTLFKVVLPAASSSLIAGATLAMGRAAGETAPIMFTGAAFFVPRLAFGLFDQVMALPYHILVLATSSPNPTLTKPLQFAAALVLVGLVFLLTLFGMALRHHYSKKGGR